jgi:hypothetical protein
MPDQLGGAYIDAKQLDTFLNHYYNLPLPGGSVSSILAAAFHAFLDSGVVAFDDGTDATTAQVGINDGRVFMSKPDPANPTDRNADDRFVWVPGPQGTLPSFDAVIVGLAQLLVDILNAEPSPDRIPWPHTLN